MEKNIYSKKIVSLQKLFLTDLTAKCIDLVYIGTSPLDIALVNKITAKSRLVF